MVLVLPVGMIGITLNSVIRADGSPRFAMCSMLLGAIINTILDPIFIFLFHWGVSGAALATILGQIASFALSVFYLKRFKNIAFSFSKIGLNFQIIRRVLSLGLSRFVNHLPITVVIIIMNNTLVIYGAASAYGSEIPLAALGIVMKVNQIMMAVLIGISAGTQPIVGYNYGAGNYARVKKSYLISVSIATGWAVLAFLCFQFSNGPIISLFGQESDMYNAFAEKCFRVYLMMVFLTGFQVVSSIFFQAIGKPVQATVLSLSRQILFFIPALLVLPRFFGIDGALYAGPFADVMAFLLALVFILVEMRLLSKQHAQTMAAVSSCEVPAEG